MSSEGVAKEWPIRKWHTDVDGISVLITVTSSRMDVTNDDIAGLVEYASQIAMEDLSAQA